MPCFHPLQGFLVDSISKGGEPCRRFLFHPDRTANFKSGKVLKVFEDRESVVVPCGRCIGCRLERSRQVALRCVHESKMYLDNCFITLTFSPEFICKLCPLTPSGYSLVRKHTQDFMKRLRQKFSDRIIRVYGCGEYGDQNGRPHYHLCLFNLDFPDKQFAYRSLGFDYFTSSILGSLWPFGLSCVTGFSFETAAYVARYCTKKVLGEKAADHYNGRLPEFSIFSNRPGIGKPWFDKFGLSDVFPHDCCIIRGTRCSVPRYYDKLRDRIDSPGLAEAKSKRMYRALDKAYDNTYARLLVKEKCMDARVRLLVRNLEI